MLLDNLRLLARYNRWANGRLYDACARLPEADYYAARPAFFGSIHRTLNHILLADRIWLARIRGGPPVTLPLDAELHATLAGLREARTAEDESIIAYLDGLAAAELESEVRYTNSRGELFATPLGVVLQHLFNHQTHHRGQVHDMLTQTGVAPPPLDLIFFVRESGGGT